MTQFRPTIAALFQDLGLECQFPESNSSRTDWGVTIVNGIKFEMERRKSGQWRLIAAYGPGAKREALKEAFPCETPNPYYLFDTPEAMLDFAADVLAWIQENYEAVAPKAKGVTFADTNFEGYGERDFMAALVQLQAFTPVIPGVGTNLRFEFQAASTGSRIDAVELDADGNVITVIECQSGIQHGDYLDGEHFEKAVCRYPLSAEVAETVQKVVIIAGGYSPEQLRFFAASKLPVVPLVTSVVDGRIQLVPAA
jgi:hypothetical protein